MEFLIRCAINLYTTMFKNIAFTPSSSPDIPPIEIKKAASISLIFTSSKICYSLFFSLLAKLTIQVFPYAHLNHILISHKPLLK